MSNNGNPHGQTISAGLARIAGLEWTADKSTFDGCAAIGFPLLSVPAPWNTPAIVSTQHKVTITTITDRIGNMRKK